MIYLKTYDSETNPDAYLDSELSFEEQTQVCQDYINQKSNCTEIPTPYDDGHLRPSKRVCVFNDGFTVEFKQHYVNTTDWLLEREEVTNIIID